MKNFTIFLDRHKTAKGSTGTLDSNTSGSSVDLDIVGSQFDQLAFNIVSNAIDLAKNEVTQRLARPNWLPQNGHHSGHPSGPPSQSWKIPKICIEIIKNPEIY